MAGVSENKISGEQWAAEIFNYAHQLAVNTENAKIGVAVKMVGQKTLEEFEDNFKNHSFFGNRWASISPKWRAKKARMGLYTGILEERGNLMDSLTAKMTSSNRYRIYFDITQFRSGPDKRHMRMYAGIHNEGLPGSGGPHKRRKRQIIGYLPSLKMRDLGMVFANQVFFRMKGSFV